MHFSLDQLVIGWIEEWAMHRHSPYFLPQDTGKYAVKFHWKVSKNGASNHDAMFIVSRFWKSDVPGIYLQPQVNAHFFF